MKYPDGLSVHALFERQVGRTPASVALDGSEGPMTYRVLHNRVLRLAHALRISGVVGGDVVATCLEPSVDTVAAFLAVLSVGAAYCPMDPRHPITRHEFTLDDARPTLLLTTSALRDRLPTTAIRTLFLDDPTHFLTPTTEPPAAVPATSAACVLYTSGSTGKPKGALIPHQGIVRLVFGMPDARLRPESRVLQHSPLTFDISTFEIFGPLLHGGTCVIFPGGHVPTLHELKETIRRYGVNCLFFGPAPANIIIDEEPDVFTGLDTLILGGEAMSAPHARKCMAMHPDIRIVNGYGPTEATTFCSSYVVPRDFPAAARSVPIGKPLARTTLYIVDEQNRLITGDTPGELLVGGDGVALGYLNRPELTAEKFIPNPFDPSGGPLYRTGDLCRHLPDGNIDYIGRMDHQIKLNGHRIELGEIETAIAKFPGVSQSVVMVRDDRGERRLAAYFTALPEAHVGADALRTHLAGQLPPYMVPTWLVPLDRMPITPSGKVDRRALPVPHVEVSSSSSPSDAPTDALERELLPLWKQVLESERVGVRDGYFELGGTSLGAMRLCALIERQTGTFVPVEKLFTCPSVTAMAAAIRDRSFAPASAKPLKHSDGPGSSLFCVPGLGGHAINFQPLGTCLAGAHPVYGLTFPGLDGVTTAARSVSELASVLIGAVRSVQPTGPYHVLGYSFGGAVAFEMARQLRADGHAVGGVILVEAFTHESFRTRRLPERLLVHGRRTVRNGLLYVAGRARQRLLTKRAMLQTMPARTDVADGRLLDAARLVDSLNEEALRNYRPAAYGGDIVSIMGRDLPDWAEFYVIDPTGGWRAHVTGAFHQRQMAGGHLTVLQEPNVGDLAAIVKDCLRAFGASV